MPIGESRHGRAGGGQDDADATHARSDADHDDASLRTGDAMPAKIIGAGLARPISTCRAQGRSV